MTGWQRAQYQDPEPEAATCLCFSCCDMSKCLPWKCPLVILSITHAVWSFKCWLETWIHWPVHVFCAPVYHGPLPSHPIPHQHWPLYRLHCGHVFSFNRPHLNLKFYLFNLYLTRQVIKNKFLFTMAAWKKVWTSWTSWCRVWGILYTICQNGL